MMRAGQNVTTVFAQNAPALAYFCFYILDGGARQRLDNINATVKAQPVAKFSFQPLWVHISGFGLNWVQQIYPHIDQVWNQREYRAIAVIHYLLAIAFGEFDDFSMPGPDIPCPHIFRDHQRLL